MPETRIPEALALLREKGWLKGAYTAPDGSHCIAEAMLNVHDLNVGEWNDGMNVDRSAILSVVRAQYGHAQYGHAPTIAGFNDDPATTFADVEFVLEKAALERGGAL